MPATFDRLGGFRGGVLLAEPILPASSLTRNTRNTALPLLRPSPPVPICSTLARRPPAVAVAVCFEKKNTALSRGWRTPLARGSAVCGAKRIAQHENPGLLS